MKTVANSTKSAYPSYDQADFFDGTAARQNRTWGSHHFD